MDDITPVEAAYNLYEELCEEASVLWHWDLEGRREANYRTACLLLEKVSDDSILRGIPLEDNMEAMMDVKWMFYYARHGSAAFKLDW